MGNFEIILGAVMALNESSFQCPHDVSLIGFDDLIISNLSNPRITLVVQPLQDLAENAAKLLLGKMDKDRNSSDEEPEEDTQMPGDLILPARIVEGNSIARVE
jgi:LacI family transcriptional regulator